MGQYYQFMNIDKKQKCNQNQGMLKLMEHSYLRNEHCNDILLLLSDKWKNDVVIHVGDYAEKGDNTTTSNLIGNISDKFKTKSMYDFCEHFEDIKVKESKKKIRYVYNHDKKEYIDLLKQPIQWYWIENDKIQCAKINSFALLVACGNERGGGDYYGINKDKVGYWAGDHLESSASFIRKYKDYNENNIIFDETLNLTDNKWMNETVGKIVMIERMLLHKEIESYHKAKKGNMYNLSFDTDGYTDIEREILGTQLAYTQNMLENYTEENEAELNGI